MKILRVGDPHVTVRNLEESWKLIEFIQKVGKAREVDRIEFMGDLFHTHAVMRVEVVNFWHRAFEYLDFPILALVGNHDQPGSKEKEQEMNALQVYQDAFDHVRVVSAPFINNGIVYAPYMSDKQKLIEKCNSFEGAKTLIAHETFTGAQYENGFYAPDGVDPGLINIPVIISGHIHKSQQVGKCFYVGTPKWDSMSDANEDKGIWIFKHSEDGSVVSEDFVSTKEVLTPIYKYVMHEGFEEPELVDGGRHYIELNGKSSWIKKMVKKYKGKASIKAKPTDRKVTASITEDSTDIWQYLDNHFELDANTSKEAVKSFLKAVGL